MNGGEGLTIEDMGDRMVPTKGGGTRLRWSGASFSEFQRRAEFTQRWGPPWDRVSWVLEAWLRQYQAKVGIICRARRSPIRLPLRDENEKTIEIWSRA